MSKTLIFDNGCSTIKAGFVTDEVPRIIPNCIFKTKTDRKRVYIGDEIEECKDHSSIFFLTPAEKGYIVKWDVQQKVWDRVMGKNVLDISFNDTRLVITDPIYNVPAIRDYSDEILFEQYNFCAVAKTGASSLIALADTVSPKYRDEQCCVVVDSGFSFTHIIPYYNGSVVRDGIIRIDVGGKILTNLLKEWISYRQLDVMEETYVMNECKEDVCLVADDFYKHMEIARQQGEKNTIACTYILPDFLTYNRGFIRDFEQSEGFDDLQKLRINVERFAVPEVLFSPSDIGISQMGIPEAIAYAVNKCPFGMRGRLFNNIIVCGGNASFKGFRQRIYQMNRGFSEKDLRTYVDQMYDVNLRPVDDPLTHAWHCGRDAAVAGALDERFVSKAEYSEHGSKICKERFFSFC